MPTPNHCTSVQSPTLIQKSKSTSKHPRVAKIGDVPQEKETTTTDDNKNGNDRDLSQSYTVQKLNDMWEQDPVHFELLPRVPLSTTSYLRPGSRFEGTQQSGRSTYEVEVEFKNVDLNNGFLCGYFKIDGLSDHHPTLVTYFQAEIIGDKYSFFTKRPSWGANEKTDLSHWSRFGPWRNIPKARDPQYVHSDFLSHQYIFMRWKECFLVPDHTVRELANASYAGFYYIMFNQLNGTISGYYFHENSDKFQQLDLSPCESDRYVMQQGGYEFR